MLSTDVLDLRFIPGESTYAWHESPDPQRVEGDSLHPASIATVRPSMSRWGQFVTASASLWQDEQDDTAAAHEKALGIDAYWSGPVRNRRLVLAALDLAPRMHGLLISVQDRLSGLFDEARLVLEGDPDGRQIYVVVETALPVDEAQRLLAQFDHDWWLANMDDANGNLSVVLDLV